MKQSPIKRCFSVLEAIAGLPAPRLSDLANSCQLPISTTHRAIKTLVDAGLVVASAERGGSYGLGPRLLRLLHTGSDESWIKIVAQRFLDDLAERLGETSYMTKLTGGSVISVAWATPPDGLKAYVLPGLSQPLHAAASAKAILAFQASGLIQRLLVGPFPRLCTETKTTLEGVLAELADVRRSGYATCVNENEAGIAAVACPVYLASGEVLYSIGVTGIVSRFPPAKLAEYAEVLKEVASSLSHTIKPISDSGL